MTILAQLGCNKKYVNLAESQLIDDKIQFMSENAAKFLHLKEVAGGFTFCFIAK